MKRTVIASIFGIIVVGALLFLIATNANISSPNKTVERFFDAWFNGSYVDSGDITDVYKKTIEEIVSSPAFEGYDPVVCSREFPTDIEIIPISETDARAEVSVREYFESMVKDIKVILIRTNARWQIANIECGDIPAQKNLNIKVAGAIVERDGNYVLVYELPGKPALTYMLDFSNWRCEETDRCIPLFDEGTRVRVIGKKINEQTLLVDSITEI